MWLFFTIGLTFSKENNSWLKVLRTAIEKNIQTAGIGYTNKKKARELFRKSSRAFSFFMPMKKYFHAEEKRKRPILSPQREKIERLFYK